MSLNLNDLRLFFEIVENRGILPAARALGLPKSTISRRLSGLEEQLKSRLVHRSGDAFALTAAGELTYALARRVVEAARQAEEQLLSAHRQVTGQVVVSVSPMLAAHAAEAIALLIRAHPGLAVHLDITERLPEALGDGPDLYLRAHCGALRDSALIQRRVCRSPLILVAAPGLQLANPDEILAHGFLAFGAEAGLG